MIPLIYGYLFVIICYILHKILQFSVYLIFGINYCYINPFNLSIHHLNYESSNNKNVNIEIRKIKLHLSLFKKSKYYFKLSLFDLNFNISGLFEANNPNDKNSKKNINSNCIETKLFKSLNNKSYDPDAPVIIYPNNKKLKRLIRFLFKILPHLSFIINNVKIILNSEFSINFTDIVGQTDINKPINKKSFLRKNSNFLKYIWSSSLQLNQCILYNNKSNQILSKFFNRCETIATVDLDITTGIITSFEPIFRLLEIDISIIYLLKVLKSINPNLKINNNYNNDSNNHLKNHKLHKIHKYKLYIYGFIFRLLKNASISIQSINIYDIPLTTSNKLNNFLNNSNDNINELNDAIFIKAKIAAISLNLGPINPNQVGYSLKFVEGSFPLQWIITLNNLSVSLNYYKIKNYSGKTKEFDIIFIPNLLFTMESTMMINLLRVVFNNSIQENFIKKQTITTIQLTIANPSIDISTEQLSILLKVLKEKKSNDTTYNKKNSTPVDNGNDNEDNDVLRKENEKRKIYYKNIFLNTSPKFQIKLFIEKPLLIVKSENEIVKNKNIHLATFQPSMINLQFDIQTIKKIMNFNFRFDIPDISMIYQRNNSNKSATTFNSIRDFNLRLYFQLFEFNNLKINFNLGEFLIDLTDLEAINGLSIVFNSFNMYLTKNKPSLKHKKNSNPINIRNFFGDLPSWFSEYNISLKEIKIIIGSKSLFLPANELLDEQNQFNNIFDDKTYVPSSVVYKIGKLEFIFKNIHQTNDSDDSTSLNFSEFSKTPDDYYWVIANKIQNVRIITKSLHPSYDININEKILKIPELDLTFYCLKNGTFEYLTVIPSIDVSHTISSHFTLFSSFYLLKNAISYHKFDISTKEDDSKIDNNKIQTKKRAILDLITIKWYIKEAQIKMMMPQNFSLRIDMFDLKGFFGNHVLIMDKKVTRVYVKKNPEANLFVRFITLDNMKCICKLPKGNKKLMKISISHDNMRFSIPSNFIVHSFFDAIILTAKLTKKFIKSIKTGPVSGLDKVSSSGVINLPHIKIKSNTMALTIQDDLFETELGMIYQLGLLEQRARLEKLKYFNIFIDNIKGQAIDTFSNDEDVTKLNDLLDELLLNPTLNIEAIENEHLKNIITDCHKKLHRLRLNISKSWILLVKEYNIKRNLIVEANTQLLTESIVSSIVPSFPFDLQVVNFNNNPPLMSLLFNDFVLTLNPPLFENDSNDVHQFLHRVGKGVPKNTYWDKVIPLGIKLKACEVRVHLRDFPLPFVYIPNYKTSDRWSDSFVLEGTLVLSEPMPDSDDQYWYLHIPMYDDFEEGKTAHNYYSWDAPKTITSVKSYYEINCYVNSDNSTMVTWSTSYQAVLRHLSICFDTFSKATRDPSPKLGIWDKLRNILHGYFKFYWMNNDAEVCFNILNTQDPYKILGTCSGFSLIFKDDVKWLINDPERESERDYFIFRSKSVLFGVPNYLSQPLPCWCTRKLIFLPADADDFFVSSFFGYYLNPELYYDNGSLSDTILAIASNSKLETHNIILNGDIEIKISMLFERRLDDGTKITTFKSHFENILTSTDRVENKENFDSYKGFRSDYIHMGLKLSAKNSTYNVLRLTPRTLYHFRKWFKQFSADIGLPIRNGNLWAAKPQSVKMGSHLMTFKFMFDVVPLYIYHGYRADLIKPDNHASIGLKAKIGSFKCDLHQRKEKKVKHVKFFNQNYSIMKMTFYVGKVDLKEIDLRIVGLSFSESKEETPLHKYEIFDNDEEWIDIEDYEEIDLPSLKSSDINGQIHPLLYASHFCYWMDKKFGKNKFGNEDSHDCYIKSEEFPNSEFHHIFDTDQMKFKWYPSARNLLYEYIASIEFRKAYMYSTSYSSVKAIYEKLEEFEEFKDPSKPVKSDSKMLGYNITNEEEFGKVMKDVSDYFKSTIAVDHMLLRFNDVQIQLMNHPNQEQLIIFRVQHNEIQIVSFMDEDWFKYVNSADIAKRFGTIFQNADLLMMSKKEYCELGKKKKHYGSNSSWPVFLDGDEPTEFIQNKTLLSDILIYLVMEKTSNSYAGNKRRNKLYVNIPKFETKIDSESYQTFFETFQHLLIYASPQQKQFAEMLEALELAMGDMDKKILLENLRNSSEEIKQLSSIYHSLTPMRLTSFEVPYIDELIRQKCSKLFSNSLVLSKIASMSCNPISNAKDDNCYFEWVISACKINIELIDKEHSFLNFIMKDCSFSRLEMLDKSTINEVTIKTIKIINTDYNILYPELLNSYEPDSCFANKYTKPKQMVKVNWELGEKVGGMHNIKNVEITLHPMKVSMEDRTGMKLMQFLFPKDIEYNEDSNNSDDSYSYEYEDIDNEGNDKKSRISNNNEDDKLKNKNSNGSSKSDHHKFNKIPEINIEAEKEDKKIDDNETDNDDKDLVKLESIENSITSDYLNISDESDELDNISSLSSKSMTSRKGSILSKEVNAKNSIVSSYSKKLNKKIVSGKILNTAAAVDNLTRMAIKSRNSDYQDNDKSLNITEISERAKLFFTIRKFVFNDFLLNVTFSGKGKLRLINVNNLTLVVPSISVRKKIWRSVDMVNAIKKHIIKALLNQTGRLIRNKLFVHKRKRRVNKLSKHMTK